MSGAELARAVVEQFHRPTGILGRLAGAIMYHRPSNRQRNEWAVELVAPKPEARVLEVGFGPGYAIERLAERCPAGKIIGIDHSETMLRVASKRNRAAIEKGLVELRLASASEISELPGSFDAVFAVNSYHFWDDRVAVLGRVLARLSGGGTLAIVEQPRGRGATNRTARAMATIVGRQLEAAGFTDVRIDVLPLEPVCAVCVLGTKGT